MFDALFSSVWSWLSGHFNTLVLFGLLGQSLFMMRFLAQWLHSEKVGRSAVPEIFWVFSMGGGIVLLIYAVLKNDVVFIIGQALGLFIYARNMFFIHKTNARRKASSSMDILHALSAQTDTLLTRGEQLSASETKAVAEALHILEAHRK
jgi:lipid-A-disaccharide synthase-like uncharacterized protein